MAKELEKFHDGFFAESVEALEGAEYAVLQLIPGTADVDTINAIFRVVHSIKGSAGMFGFGEMTSFTHALESLLQELRADRIEVTAEISDALLQSIDQLRALITARREQQAPELAQSNALQAKFREWMAAQSTGATVRVAIPVWRIQFMALPELLRHGTDPIRLFEELAALGTLTVQADCSRLPLLPEIDPAHCHISWDLTLATLAPREHIDQVFEWAYGSCELKIERLTRSRSPLAPTDGSSIRVEPAKLDDLVRRVDDIVITQAMLAQLATQVDGAHAELLRGGLQQLGLRISELRDSVQRVRMLPAGSVFNRFPRLVRDLSARLGKQIHLQISGERTELDRKVLEKIGDPLVHIVRNSVDHGIESPELRAARGKSVEGVVRLSAVQCEGLVKIIVSDDGNGLDTGRLLETARSKGLVDPAAVLTDAQIHELVFLPGFSTAAQATELSGRGVGMDVVRRNINELGGSVELDSQPGKGTTTTITLSLPTCARNSA